MSEFLIRGYNAATPEVDRGDDIFVVQDASGDLSRIQVKTATAKETKSETYTAQFKVGLKQLQTAKTPDIHYVFAVRRAEGWGDYLVISRAKLHALHVNSNLGGVVDEGKSLLFTFSDSTSEIRCGSESVVECRNDWGHWPSIDP